MTAQKDFPGDRLQLLERAREDACFRLLDRKPVAKRHEQTEQDDNADPAIPRKPAFSPILVPVDFSAYSAEAVDHAGDIAESLGSALIALHVTSRELGVYELANRLARQSKDIPFLGTEEIQAACEQVMEEIIGPQREKDYEVLQAFLPERLLHLPVELRVVSGQPFERILETALAEDVGLIVMGTHGRSGLERVALGSVAERVVRLAPCPVLTVKAAIPESRNLLKELYSSFLPSRE